MQLSLTQRLAIDRACGEFEDILREGGTPAHDRWLSAAESPGVRSEMLIELLTIQMEYSLNRPQHLSVDESRGCSRIPAEGPSLLSHVFRETFDELADPLVFRRILAREFAALVLRREELQLNEFLAWAASDDVMLPAELANVLATRRGATLVVSREGDVVASLLVSKNISIGRQARCEPKPVCWLDEHDHVRLIIDDLQNRQMSRRQVYLERTSLNDFRVTNTGSKHPLCLNGSIELAPQGQPLVVSDLRLEWQQFCLVLDWHDRRG